MSAVNHDHRHSAPATASFAADFFHLQALLAAEDYGRLQEALTRLRQTAVSADDRVLVEVIEAALQVAATCQELQSQKQKCQSTLTHVGQQQQAVHDQLGRLMQAVGAVTGGGVTRDVDVVAETERATVQPAAVETAVSPSTNWWLRLRQWWQTQRGGASAADTALLAEDVVEVAFEQPATPVVAQPYLLVHCLGPFRLLANDYPVEKWGGAKAKLIFKYLALHREQPAHQEVLMACFWPNVDPDSARHSLYQAIYLLRQTLQSADGEFPFLMTEESSYSFHPALTLWVDRDVFMQHLEAGRRLAQQERWETAVAEFEIAESLYEGDLLIEDPYEEWLLAPREELRLAYLDLLDQLGRYYYQQQRWGRCVAYCRQILQRDACREDVQRRLMRAYAAQGQRYLAIRQYYACRRSLEDELGVAPMPETEALFTQLKTAV